MANKFNRLENYMCAMDPQIYLSKALENRSLIDFRLALEMGADPCLYDDRNTNIYEKALGSHGCVAFVEECLKRNCPTNHMNWRLNKAAINYVVDSRDPEIFALLLRGHNDVDINHQFNQLTPINSLSKNLTQDNANDILACMKLLIERGASVNITDQRQMTPLNYILKNNKIDDVTKRGFIRLFLTVCDLDIDSYRDGEARTILSRDFPDIILPAMVEDRNMSGEHLLSLIRSGDVTHFLTLFNGIDDKILAELLNNKKYREPLLIETIKRGANATFETLINRFFEFATDANLECDTKLFEVAVIWGNWYVLEKLLQNPKIKWRSKELLLVTAIEKMNEVPVYEYSDHRKCFYILLQSEDININATDKSGSTALHYAVKFRNNVAVEELLKRGAYIGAKSTFGVLPLDGIHPELLEAHFNSCISSNGLKIGDENFEICINYMNLLPELSTAQAPCSNLLTGNRKYPAMPLEEMAAISHIAKSKEYRYLLQHPLITSFLFLKWHRLSLAFYMNFFLYVFFAISIITHTVLKFRESESETITLLFGLFSWMGIVYLFIRELVQFIISPVYYCYSLTNWMEMALIVLSVLTCMEPTYDRETQRVIAVFTMLLISIELCLLVGSLPVLSISTHMLMLDAVCRSFLKSFALYSIFVITFSLCFYILIGKPELSPDNGDPSSNDTEKGNDDFNKFSNPLAAVIKTIVMLTGEFDAGDIEFDSFYSYFLFLLFVLLMTIVLFNLLNGLAVSDTQAIKDQAELNGAICRTQVLTRYEQVLTGYSKYSINIGNQRLFRLISLHFLNLYPNYMAGRQISILPNNGNKVLIPINVDVETKTIADSEITFLRLSDTCNGKAVRPVQMTMRYLPCCCSYISGKCSEMDRRTIKLALAVIEQRSVFLKSQIRLQKSEQHMQIIENKLDKLFELLQELKSHT